MIGSGMFWVVLLVVLLLLGLAYSIWNAATKKSGAAKSTRQIVAIIIAVIAVIILLYAGTVNGCAPDRSGVKVDDSMTMPEREEREVVESPQTPPMEDDYTERDGK